MSEYVFDNGQLKAVAANEVESYREKGASVVNVPQYKQHTESVENAIKLFKSAEKRIKESQNPADTDEVKGYLIAEERKKLEQAVADAQKTWESERHAIVAEAERNSARHSVKITEQDKQVAQSFAYRQLLDIATKPQGSDRAAALNKLATEARYLSDAEKLALAPHLMELSRYKDEGANVSMAVSNVFRELGNLQDPAFREAEAMRQFSQNADPTTSYRIFKIARGEGRK